MKVHLRLFLPVLPEAIGRKELQVEFAGETVNDLLDHLIACYGRKAREALYNQNGDLDSLVQVLVNGEHWVAHDRLDTVLQDGDELMLMILIGGG
jgi:MoaD family protein